MLGALGRDGVTPLPQPAPAAAQEVLPAGQLWVRGWLPGLPRGFVERE